MIPLVAAARLVEERLRTSRTLRRAARGTLALLARYSKEARSFVRIRTRRIV